MKRAVRIDAGVTKAFLNRGYNVVADSLDFSETTLRSCKGIRNRTRNRLRQHFRYCVAKGGAGGFACRFSLSPIPLQLLSTCVFSTKPFTQYTPEDFEHLSTGGPEALTRSLAVQYAKDGIRFNALAPGVVNTPMHAKDSRVLHVDPGAQNGKW